MHTRDLIVNEARRSFLRSGRVGIGVDGIMQNAGLTAGGFYAHFDSKDELFALAMVSAFEHSMSILFDDLEAMDGTEAITKLTQRYLSRDHREHVDEGCPMPALAADVARSCGEIRAKFESGLNAVIAKIQTSVIRGDDSAARERALALVALYVGGMMLSRATRGSTVSDEILGACENHAHRVPAAGGQLRAQTA
jgi:TetR/AcrR family transcriptional repressor of nem operon